MEEAYTPWCREAALFVVDSEKEAGSGERRKLENIVIKRFSYWFTFAKLFVSILCVSCWEVWLPLLDFGRDRLCITHGITTGYDMWGGLLLDVN